MAKKKQPENPPPAATTDPIMTPTPKMPQAVPGMPPVMPGMPPGMPGMPQANPMMAMMQMMQMMMGGGMAPSMVDPSAVPFAGSAPVADVDKGLDADLIRPALLDHRIKVQHGVKLGSVLDSLCLTDDRQHALGGIPKGCTIAFAGPPGKGKTRTVLAGLARVACDGNPVAFVVAEEGFHNDEDSGRDDLCSRMIKIGMSATGLSEAEFTTKVLEMPFTFCKASITRGRPGTTSSPSTVTWSKKRTSASWSSIR